MSKEKEDPNPTVPANPKPADLDIINKGIQEIAKSLSTLSATAEKLDYRLDRLLFAIQNIGECIDGFKNR